MTMERVDIPLKKMNDGHSIPMLGLGTYRSGIGRQTRDSVLHAFKVGYRHIDTASVYGNERDVGEAIRLSGLEREEVFITTKLWNTDQGYEPTIKALDRSLKVMELEYVDLYLIHWPVSGAWKGSWKAMEQLKEEGKARSIGVSNFTMQHLDELLLEANIVPAVDQVEFSPFLYQKDLLDHCSEKGIVMESYSPLTKGIRLSDPVLIDIANDQGMTPAQVMIGWSLNHGLVTIPKSTKPERIEENLKALTFKIDRSAMKLLDGLHEGLRTGWDPSNEP